MPRGVPGRSVRLKPGHAFLLGRHGLQRGPALQLAYVELGHRRLAPGLGHRPGELSRADDDSRLAEQDPVERMVVMRVREYDVGHVGRLQAALRELRDQALPHAEAADVHQSDAPAAADQRDRAPAQAPVAHHPSGKTLDEHVDLVVLQLDRFHFFTPPGFMSAQESKGMAETSSFATPARTASPCSGSISAALYGMPLLARFSSSRASSSPGSRISSKPSAFGHARTRSTRVSMRERYSFFDTNRSGLIARKKCPTFCGRSNTLYWSATSPAQAAPESTPPKMSISIERPEPFGPPIGRTTPFRASAGSVVGRPSASSA